MKGFYINSKFDHNINFLIFAKILYSQAPGASNSRCKQLRLGLSAVCSKQLRLRLGSGAMWASKQMGGWGFGDGVLRNEAQPRNFHVAD